jgi:hypothetical protein
VCVGGGAECLTPKELADRREAERKQKEEQAATQRRLKEEQSAREKEDREATEWLRKERARLAEEERRKAAAAEAERKEEEHQRAVAEQKAEAERKRTELKELAEQKMATALAEAQKKKEEAQKLLDEQREIARMQAEYKELKSEADRLKGVVSTKSSNEKCETVEEMIQDFVTNGGKHRLPQCNAPTVSAKSGTLTDCSVFKSVDECSTAILNNPNESLAARQIAAFALGKDPKSVAALANADQPTPPPASGNQVKSPASVVLNPDTKDVKALTAPALPTSSSTPESISPPSYATCSTFGGGDASLLKNGCTNPKDQTNPLTSGFSVSQSPSKTTTNNAVKVAENIGMIGIDCLAAAGGALSQLPTWAKVTGNISDLSNLGSGVYQAAKGNYLGSAQTFWMEGFVYGAGKVAGPAGACVAQASSEIGQQYIAPLVSSYGGEAIFNMAPSLFTPQ